ncbi:MAG: hypothetical protein M3Q44_05720 [bacterium]|nr:hypothetical protein [bacterium]
MDPTQQRIEDLKKFADEYALFDAAFREIPNEKLSLLKKGDEYSLSGLIVHVTEILAFYTDVINRISILPAGHATEFHVSQDISDYSKKIMHDGVAPSDRPRMLEVLKRTQRYFDDRVNQLPPDVYTVQTPIFYDDDGKSAMTSPALVVKWVTEHYIDHTKTIRDEIGPPPEVIPGK